MYEVFNSFNILYIYFTLSVSYIYIYIYLLRFQIQFLSVQLCKSFIIYCVWFISPNVQGGIYILMLPVLSHQLLPWAVLGHPRAPLPTSDVSPLPYVR